MNPLEQMQSKMKTFFEIRNEFLNKYKQLLRDPEATEVDLDIGKAFCNLICDLDAVAKCPKSTL